MGSEGRTGSGAVPGFLPRRPAVAATCLFILGILSHEPLPHLPLLWLPMIAALVVGAILMFPYPRVCSACLAAGLLLGGVCIAQIEHYYYPANHINLFAGEEPRLAQLELRLEHPPRVLANPQGQPRPLPPRQVMIARVVRVKTWDGWTRTSGDMLVAVQQPHPRLAAEQTLRVTGMLQRPAPAMNPGQFNWERYYREQRVLVSLRISQAEQIEIIATRRTTPLMYVREKVRSILSMGFPQHRSIDHALLRAILVGDRDPEMRDVQEQFRRTGTSHHLAISGLHVGILGGFVYLLCRLLRLTPRTSAWVLMCFVIGYGFIALPSPPVVRAVLICAAFCAGLIAQRQHDPVQLLTLAALSMLIYHPLDLFNAGFCLSFGTVLGLVVFTPVLSRWMNRTRDDDPLIGPAPLLHRIRHRLFDVTSAALVAWTVSIPLVAYHFERLNPWTVFGSIMLGPVVMLALAAGLIKIILTVVLPGFASWWAELAAWPIMLMRWMVEQLEKLPLSDVPLGPPSLSMIAIYYTLLCLPMLASKTERLRTLVRLGPVTACLLAFSLPALMGLGPRAPGSGELRMTLLAVGAGQCAVVELPSGQTVLFDAGSMSLADAGRNCIAPFLRHRGRRHVGAVYLSHPHVDHFSALDELIPLYNVREIWASHHFVSNSAGNPGAEGLLRLLRQQQLPLRVADAGDRIWLGPGILLEVLWPDADLRLDADNASLVVRLSSHGRSILFPGDIQEAAMRELLKQPHRLRADVLVAPHHGSSESSTAAFLEAVDPQVILSSNSRRLSMKQRELETMIADRPLYRTHRSGAITVVIDDSGTITLRPFLQKSEPGELILAP